MPCAVNDFTLAMENYGGVVIQAGHNHAVAEHNATPGATGTPPTKPPEPASVTGVLSAPPSAGGPGQGLLDDALGLVEQVGVPVPDGDTDKVDTAAQGWDRLATVYQTRTVVEALDVQDYKAALDDLRTQLEGILTDLAIELAVTAVIAIAASFISFGAGAVAGTAKAAHSITKFAKIITSAVSAWKISKNVSNGVKKAHDIAGIRKRLQRIKNLGRKGSGDGPKVGPGVQTTSGRPLTTTREQIEKKFDKHAEDFGITEPRGKAGFEQFEQAVKSHVDDPSTLHVNGTYRGEPAIINYNPNTSLAVIQKPNGEFVSGWQLDPQQAANVLQRGSLR